MDTIVTWEDTIESKSALEDEWDTIIDEIILFGEQQMDNYDNMPVDYHGLLYELRLPVFEYFFIQLDAIMKAYSVSTIAFCNDPAKSTQEAKDCRATYNSELNLARLLMEDMNHWLINALSIINNETYSYPILSKTFDPSTTTIDRPEQGGWPSIGTDIILIIYILEKMIMVKQTLMRLTGIVIGYLCTLK